MTSNDSQTVGQQLSLAVTAGSTYTVTKSVGVVTAPDAASSYDLLVSTDGTNWTTAAQVRDRTQGTQDELTFQPVRARYIRVQITAATYGTPPMLEEITAPGGQHP